MGWADVQGVVVLFQTVRWQHRPRGVSPLPERHWAGAWDPPTSWRMTRHSSAACPALRREEAEVSSARPRTEAWLYSHLNGTDCSFSISPQNPRRRHAYPKEDEQEPTRDEPRVYHPESCRYCFLCCYGVPPGVDVWGKFSPYTLWLLIVRAVGDAHEDGRPADGEMGCPIPVIIQWIRTSLSGLFFTLMFESFAVNDGPMPLLFKLLQMHWIAFHTFWSQHGNQPLLLPDCFYVVFGNSEYSSTGPALI